MDFVNVSFKFLIRKACGMDKNKIKGQKMNLGIQADLNAHNQSRWFYYQ